MGKLTQLIQRLKSTPMNVGTLKRLLPSYCVVKTFDQISSRSSLFAKHECVVMLIPSSFSKIGHFVVLIQRPRHIEYFSSLGGAPEKEVAKLGQNKEKMLKLLGKNYIYNSLPLQKQSSTIEDCGLHVLARVRLYKLKLRDYQQLFTSSVTLKDADDIVAMMTVLSLADS